MKLFFSNIFKKKSPPPKTFDDCLHEIEDKLIKEFSLTLDDEPNIKLSETQLHTRLQTLERIDEIREKKRTRNNKTFFHTAAGASVLTGIMTIMATQMPAFVQMMATRDALESKQLEPIIKAVVKDEKFDLGEKLAIIKFVSSSRHNEIISSYGYREESVEEHLERYRKEMKKRNRIKEERRKYNKN